MQTISHATITFFPLPVFYMPITEYLTKNLEQNHVCSAQFCNLICQEIVSLFINPCIMPWQMNWYVYVFMNVLKDIEQSGSI